MTWLATLFSLGYAGQAALLIVLGADAAPVLKAFAIGNVVLCTLLLWAWHFVINVGGDQRGARRRLVPVGVLLFAPAFFLPTLAGWYEQARLTMRSADTDLFDVTDEPLLSARGNVVGVRVGFTLIPPQTGYYSIEPVLLPPADTVQVLTTALQAAGLADDLFELRTVRRVIDPLPRAINVRRLSEEVLDRAGGGLYLEDGVAYGFTFDLIPGYLLDPRDPLPVRNVTELARYCLALPESRSQRAAVERMASLDRPHNYRIAVSQTTFGWDGGDTPARATTALYAPAMFYRGVLAEGAPACPSGN